MTSNLFNTRLKDTSITQKQRQKRQTDREAIIFLNNLFFILSTLVFACIYVYVRALHPLEQELQTVVSCHEGARN